MNKKGDMLEKVSGMILIVIFAVIVIYFFIAKIVLGPTNTKLASLTCTAFAYGRGLFVRWVMNAWDKVLGSGFLLGLLSVGATVGGGAAFGVTSGATALQWSWGAEAMVIGAHALDMGVKAYYTVVMYGLFLSKVPFACPVAVTDVGYIDDFATTDQLATIVGSRIVDAYDIMGAGSYSPLTAKVPNPRTIFIIETHLKEQTNFKELYDIFKVQYSENWELGPDSDLRLYVYCTSEKGNSPDRFEECTIENSRIYVMFKDNFREDEYGYGSSVCNGNMDEDPVDKDAIMICIEHLT